jgi:hypothetical protein
MLALQSAIALHVLAGSFWAGSTMTLALGRGFSLRLFAGQMVAAILVIAAGTYLWGKLHDGGDGPQEHALTIGAIAAMIAFFVQLLFVGIAAIRARRGKGDRAWLEARALRPNRIAALLLTVAVSAMAASKFAS